jgi:membrane protease YdiL (CAAX protease family)
VSALSSASVPPPPREARPPWPPWFGFAALGMALLIAILLSGVLLAILSAAGADVSSDSPGVNIGATLIQDVVLIGCAWWLAAKVAPPKPSQFGLRATPFWRGVKWAAVAFGIYFGVQLLYVALVHPSEKQTTLQDLGAGTSGIATLLIGILVVGVAPLAEEFFFRGFFYGALRTRYPWVVAALIDAVVFGIVHAPTGIQAVPPLIALGFAFCLAYEMTGSILPGVILHALNNMVAFGVDKNGSWPVAGLVAATLVAACILVPWRNRAPRPAPG